MAKDFFGSLGETLTKTAKELSGRAEEVYETQRLKNKISGEERQIEKAMADLGRIIYKRYKKEIPVDDAQKALCEQIDQRMEQIEKYKTDISELKVKNKRFCPSCGSPLAKGAFGAAPSLRRLDRHPVCLRRRASALHKTRSFSVRSSFAKVNSS